MPNKLTNSANFFTTITYFQDPPPGYFSTKNHPPDHDYYEAFTTKSASDVAQKFNKCTRGVQLVTEMETAMKNLNLLPHEINSNPGLIQLESQFLDIISSDNIVQSALYMLPIVHQGKLFLRYIEKGVYKGFTGKFSNVIASSLNLESTQIFPWIVYTDKDICEEKKRNKYKERTSTGFEQLMYRNKKSVGNLILSMESQLDELNAVIYIQIKNPRPNRPTDRLGIYFTSIPAKYRGGLDIFFLY